VDDDEARIVELDQRTDEEVEPRGGRCR